MAERDWREFALILIDVQEDFWPPGMDGKFPGFRDAVARLLATCRGEGLDILHVRAIFQPDGSDWMARYRLRGSLPCVAGTPGAQPMPCARELPGELVLYKHAFDSFTNPGVEEWLQQRGKRYVIVAGLVTAVCVLLTGMTASQRGYLVAIVEDACADQVDGMHDAVLARYTNMMERVNTTDLVARHGQWRADLQRLEELRAGDRP